MREETDRKEEQLRMKAGLRKMDSGEYIVDELLQGTHKSLTKDLKKMIEMKEIGNDQQLHLGPDGYLYNPDIQNALSQAKVLEDPR